MQQVLWKFLRKQRPSMNDWLLWRLFVCFLVWFLSGVNPSWFEFIFWRQFLSSGLILFVINSEMFLLKVKIDMVLFLFPTDIQWIKIFLKRKRQNFWVIDIFHKIEQHGEYSRLVQAVKTQYREFYCRCVWILSILTAYLSLDCTTHFCITKI